MMLLAWQFSIFTLPPSVTYTADSEWLSNPTSEKVTAVSSPCTKKAAAQGGSGGNGVEAVELCSLENPKTKTKKRATSHAPSTSLSTVEACSTATLFVKLPSNTMPVILTVLS